MDSLTTGPVDINVKTVVIAVSELLPDEDSVASELSLIGMAVKPIHPGITERLHNITLERILYGAP